MSVRGAVTLGDLVGRVDRLEVRCRRCPRAAAPDPAERCFAYFPQLLGSP